MPCSSVRTKRWPRKSWLSTACVRRNNRLKVFPAREIFFDQVPEDVPKFATFHAKWNSAYRKKWGIKNGAAKELPEKVQDDLGKLGRKVYRLLKIRGFGRIDVRL